jgi:hypothetical protein
MALIATGVRDQMPDIPGLDECYGVTVHHCPTATDGSTAIRSLPSSGADVGRRPCAVAENVDSARGSLHERHAGHPPPRQAGQLDSEGIEAQHARIVASEHDGPLVEPSLADGSSTRCDAIFFTERQKQRASLAARLGWRR